MKSIPHETASGSGSNENDVKSQESVEKTTEETDEEQASDGDEVESQEVSEKTVDEERDKEQEIEKTDEKQASRDDNRDETEKDGAEKATLDDPSAPIRLRYNFRTIQDEIGYFPGRVTVRCKMGLAIESLKNAVGKKIDQGVVPDFLRRTCLDYFFKLNVDCRKNCFHGVLYHYLLLRKIKTKKKNEMWFLICNKPVRFGMNEFCLVTGLKCGPLPSDDQCMKVLKDGLGFVEKVKEFCFPLKGKDEKNSLVGEDLLRVIRSRTKRFNDTERAGCAALYIIHTILLAADDTKQVQENYLAWVVNPTFFASYPWGRLCFEFTLSSLKKNLHEKAKEWKKKAESSNLKKKNPQPYTIGGFATAFLVWAYEAIDVFGINLGKKPSILGDAIPRLVRWHSEKTPKHLPYDWYDNLTSDNEVHCIPIMKPSKEEAKSEWIQLFEELVDEKDDTIDALVSELEKVDVLGPLDGIDELPQQKGQDQHQMLEQTNTVNEEACVEKMQVINEEDHLQQSPTRAKDTCACETTMTGDQNGIGISGERLKLIEEIDTLKKMFIEIDKKLTFVVKMLDVKAPWVIKYPANYMSSSWTRDGRQKRKHKVAEMIRQSCKRRRFRRCTIEVVTPTGFHDDCTEVLKDCFEEDQRKSNEEQET